MNDKERRRQKRKEKKARERKHPRLRSIGIPSEVNIYDQIKKWIAEGKTTDAMLQGIDLEEYATKVDATLDHFKVPPEKRSQTGNVLMRFGIMYSIQPDGTKLKIPVDNPALNYLADLWEHLNRSWGK